MPLIQNYPDVIEQCSYIETDTCFALSEGSLCLTPYGAPGYEAARQGVVLQLAIQSST